MPDFEATADELYALPPEQFVEQRDAAVRAAKSADPHAATQLRALKKPSTAAWLLNQLVRDKRDDVTSLLDLGAALRQAQSRLEGAQLRELSQQRRQAVNALVREARRLATRLGKPASESVARDVEQTLEAALANPDAAAAVESGRLTTALAPDASFDSAGPHLRVVPTDKQLAGRRAVAKNSTAATKSATAAAEARAAAEAVKRAEKAATQAATELAAATGRRDKAAGRVEKLTGELADLTERLHKIEHELGDAKREEREAGKAATAAERAARRADLAVEQAKTARDRR